MLGLLDDPRRRSVDPPPRPRGRRTVDRHLGDATAPARHDHLGDWAHDRGLRRYVIHERERGLSRGERGIKRRQNRSVRRLGERHRPLEDALGAESMARGRFDAAVGRGR